MALDEDQIIPSVLQQMMRAGALPPARITAAELRAKYRRRNQLRIDMKAVVAIAAVVALFVVLFTAGPLRSSRQPAAHPSPAVGRVNGHEYLDGAIQVRASGQITVKRIGSKDSVTVQVSNGQFSFSAKPGNYLLTGHDGDVACSSVIATVLSGQTTSAPPIQCEGFSTTAPPPSLGPQCTASDLQPSWTGMGDGGGQSIYYMVNLLNSSPSACVTGGYVGVSAYDPAGHLITASDFHSPLGQSPPTLSVTPGASVHFSVGLADVDQATGGTECSVTVGALHLIPPNESTEVQIATPTTTGYPKLCMPTIGVGPLQNGVGGN